MRKTNLFYLNDNYSNFLTFSNYGEYLTGVVLSTNHKIFPSSFICLNLDFDEEHSVNKFKMFLMRFYENKLAYLRDNYESLDKKQEDLYPLDYLFEAIYLFFGMENVDVLSSKITYFGDIVEHDYNGSYNDSICIVDFNRYCTMSLSLIENDKQFTFVESSDSVLYGWTANELYSNIIDSGNTYEITNYHNDELNKYSKDKIFIYEKNNFSNCYDKIEFNCVIPLFDINDIDPSENNNNIDESVLDNNDIYQHIPYGIWFNEVTENNKRTIKSISLQRLDGNISQTWSLVISSKFAPYPYGVKIDDQNITYDIEKYTYAELLSKQSELLEKYNEMIAQNKRLFAEIQSLNAKINQLEQLNSFNSASILDKTNSRLNNFELQIKNISCDLQNQIDRYFDNIKWKSVNDQ